MENSKDKQISWQGIFKGIMQQPIDPLKAEDLAYAINGRLYEAYPDSAQKPQGGAIRPFTGVNKSKPTKCPQCGQNALWNNKGVSKKSGAPYENLKCKNCGYIKWLSKTYDQHQQESRGDMQQIEILEDNELNEDPRQFGI